jgi:hypothetical protein
VACASRGLRTGLTDAFQNVSQLQGPVYSDPIWMVLSASPWLRVRMVWLSRARRQKDQFNIVAICQPIGGDATCSTFHHHAPCKDHPSTYAPFIPPAFRETLLNLSTFFTTTHPRSLLLYLEMTPVVAYHDCKTGVIPS